MYPRRRRMVRQALRLGLVVTIVVLAMSACGGGEKQQESRPRPLPEEPKALRPGEYRTEEFKPSFSFRVGEGWSNELPEASDALLLTREETVGLAFVNAQEVYKPTKTGTPNVVEAPEDMAGWFQQHPYLRTSEPEPVTVGGVKGVQFEVVVKDLPENYSGPCTTGELGDCVDIFESSGVGWIAFLKDNKQRQFVLEDVKGKTVAMGFTIPATEFDEQAPEAQKVIDTVKWTGS
jgi:hypothetical protein